MQGQRRLTKARPRSADRARVRDTTFRYVQKMRQSKNRLSLGDLELLNAIGTNGALSAAARELQLDHSTAFRRLGAVEQRLGVRLFERSRTGYAPTIAGELALAASARVLDELGNVEQQLAGEDLRPSGEVRVTTTDTLVTLVTPMFAALRAQHPEVTIELTVTNSFLTLTRRTRISGSGPRPPLLKISLAVVSRDWRRHLMQPSALPVANLAHPRLLNAIGSRWTRACSISPRPSGWPRA